MRKVFEFLEREENRVLSPAARLLYIYMLAKTEESINDNLIINEGFGWIIFRRDDMASVLGLTRNTTTQKIKELIKYNLITDVKMGQGLPNVIYVNGLIDDNIKKLIKIDKRIDMSKLKTAN
jgi:CRP-like cAMP-binding protein